MALTCHFTFCFRPWLWHTNSLILPYLVALDCWLCMTPGINSQLPVTSFLMTLSSKLTSPCTSCPYYDVATKPYLFSIILIYRLKVFFMINYIINYHIHMVKSSRFLYLFFKCKFKMCFIMLN